MPIYYKIPKSNYYTAEINCSYYAKLDSLSTTHIKITKELVKILSLPIQKRDHKINKFEYREIWAHRGVWSAPHEVIVV